MGPKLISKKSKKTNIAYSLRLFPIGGFVSMVGEDEESEDKNALSKKPVWQRMIVTAAGAFCNFVLGFLIVLIMVIGPSRLGTTVVAEFSAEAPPSYAAGLREGDEIIRVNSTRVNTSYQLAYEIMWQGNEPVDLTVMRNGEKTVIGDISFASEEEDGITTGSMDFKVYSAEKSFGNVIKYAFYYSLSCVKMVWDSIIGLLTGRVGLSSLSGPVGVSGAIGTAAKSGASSFLHLCALLSINLGVFNLLPLPALDGGRLLFQLIELVAKKPINRKYEAMVHFAGMVLLLTLMFFITFKDIVKLF